MSKHFPIGPGGCLGEAQRRLVERMALGNAVLEAARMSDAFRTAHIAETAVAHATPYLHSAAQYVSSLSESAHCKIIRENDVMRAAISQPSLAQMLTDRT